MKIHRMWAWSGFLGVVITGLLNMAGGAEKPISPALEAFGIIVWFVCMSIVAIDIGRFVRRIRIVLLPEWNKE